MVATIAEDIAVRHPDRGQPRYFHLLWDEDLDDLREVFEIIRDRRTEVTSYWYQLYVLHFGDSRSLSEAEFRSIFEPALFRNKSALLRKDMDAYAGDILSLGANWPSDAFRCRRLSRLCICSRKPHRPSSRIILPCQRRSTPSSTS